MGSDFGVQDRITRLAEGLTKFADDMRAQGIHVGLSQGADPARCCVCDELWPCAYNRGKR